MKSRYRRLAEIVSDPSFSHEKGNPLYIEYCGIYMDLTPQERHYWRNREELSVERRGKYAEKVGHGPRPYTRGQKDYVSPDISRAGFPEGPEGSILYQKAYQKEWQRLNVVRVTEQPGYERKYRKTGKYSVSLSRRRESVERRHAWLASLSRAFFDKGRRAMWSVEGSVSASLTYRGGPSLKESLAPLPPPAFTLEGWMFTLGPDGKLRAAVDSLPAPVKAVLGPRVESLLSAAGDLVPEYLSIIDVFRKGDSTLDKESFEYMREVYTKGKELIKEAGLLSRELRRAVVAYWKEAARALRKNSDIVLDTDPACLMEGPLAVWSVKSALMSARNRSFREGMLYHTLHRRTAWKQAENRGRIDGARAREDGFRALDSLLSAAGMTSKEYWEMKNSAGKSSVDVKGVQMSQAPADTVAAGRLARKGV